MFNVVAHRFISRCTHDMDDFLWIRFYFIFSDFLGGSVHSIRESNVTMGFHTKVCIGYTWAWGLYDKLVSIRLLYEELDWYRKGIQNGNGFPYKSLYRLYVSVGLVRQTQFLYEFCMGNFICIDRKSKMATGLHTTWFLYGFCMGDLIGIDRESKMATGFHIKVCIG